MSYEDDQDDIMDSAREIASLEARIAKLEQREVWWNRQDTTEDIYEWEAIRRKLGLGE